ncbi:MAG TPA: S-layer homology domain-containing protein [Chloroflexia bacterium]|nr:S-layer homology domain-containing protein [Chloroflexia bacterium]
MKRTIAAVAALLLILGVAALSTRGGYTTSEASAALASVAEAQKSFGPPQVIRATHSDTSPPLRTLKSKPLPPSQMGDKEIENPRLPNRPPPLYAPVDTVVQSAFGALAMPTPIITFEGYRQADNYANNNGLGVLPPDTQGDIGPNHYFQWNNIGIRIFDRAGNTVYGPVNGNTIFDQFTPNCAQPFPAGNNGDPIVLYDTMAGRWIASQFKVNQTLTGPSYQCIAISTDSDPTGSYHRYEFLTSANLFEDYPHFGVWPEAYYMATNEFSNAVTFDGAGFFAFDRAKMLVGDATATMQYYHLAAPEGGYLPSDLDGATLPPAGSPNFFITSEDVSPDRLKMYKFHADFITPTNSTFVGPILINVAPFDSELCTADRGACIPQPNTAQALETLSDRLMYRLAYRNFGTHESLVVNQTVDADGAGKGGVRWYELRSPNTTPVVYQQSTYAPDADHRWMGSIAQDRQGNMALGFSVSNASTLFPTIRYTGRLVTDPLNQMSQGETTMYPGGGSQTGYARWGDYSMMGIDPLDDCTFWYTQEYYASTSDGEWTTRVGSFKFPGCTAGGITPTATVTGTPPTATSTVTIAPPTATGTSTGTSTPGGPTSTPAATLPPKEVLYDQFNQQSVLGSPSFRGSTFIQVADDFTVPMTQTWEVNRVEVDGFYDPDTARATTVDVIIYAASPVTPTLPGAAVFTQTNIIPDGGLNDGVFNIPLNPPASLPAGTFWVSVIGNINGAGRWLWLDRLPPPAGNPAVARSPANINPACRDWNLRGICVAGSGADPDQTFRLTGRRFVSGGGGTATVTATVGGTSTAVATGTNTAVLPSATMTAVGPTSTLIPTQTPGGATATLVPTQTALPTGTNTVAVPTATVTAIVPSATTTAIVPTQTQVGATSTLAPTQTASATRTNTVVAPSATRTATVVPTQTSVGATATIVPTTVPTSTALPSNTVAVPSATQRPPTQTPVGPTNTIMPTSAPSNTVAVPSSTAVSSATPRPPTQTPGGATSIPTNTVAPSNTVAVPSATQRPATQTPGGTTATTEPTSTPQPTATVCTISFTDVPPDSTFYIWIRCLACRGIISGYSDGTFKPGNEITRGQIAKMVSNAAGFEEDPGPQIYEDVNLDNPFYRWINRLSMRGHMGGYECGLVPEEPCVPPDNRPYFRPFANATRGQLSKIVSNAAGIVGDPSGLYYTDVPPSNPFYVWIMRLTNIGVMSGYPCGGPGEPCDEENRPYFRPFTNVTRGQASKIVSNTFFPDCQTPSRP